jgi:hypothetical protein
MAENGRKMTLVVQGGRGLARGEAALIIALACGDSAREAAEKSGLGERTVYRRIADDQFMSKVYRARELMISQAVGKLSATCAKAADTLEELLHNESPRVRLQAAQALLNSAIRLADNWAMEVRLGRLEGLMSPLSDKERKGSR